MKVDPGQKILVLILFLLLGPLATIVVGMAIQKDEAAKTPSLIIGVLQILTCWFFGLGLLWSLYTLYKIWTNSG